MGVVQGASLVYDANLDKVVSPPTLRPIFEAVPDSKGVEYDYLPSNTLP